MDGPTDAPAHRNTPDQPQLDGEGESDRNELNRPVEAELVAALVYFIICFGVFMLVRRLQEKIQIVWYGSAMVIGARGPVRLAPNRMSV